MRVPEEKIVINNRGDYLVDTDVYDKGGHYIGKASLSLIKLVYCGLPQVKEEN